LCEVFGARAVAEVAIRNVDGSIAVQVNEGDECFFVALERSPP
jgi:hypothetical protein